ncbi:RnfABCDGE type electron transport complex subunit D [Candidatus Bipolaricaulota bacterium]|nr:RnfABCDGE type electron transport complex subunit D [Candidatus Bipolaricaulota bacterium]
MDKDKRQNLVLSPSPHLHGSTSISKDMYLVIAALLLPTAGAIYFFGLYVLLMLATSVLAAILTEVVAKKMRRLPFFMDGSAIVTALLFVLILPPRTPLWVVLVGSIFSIAIVKEAFGGLGYNIFNPALAGRAFVSVSFAGALSRWIAPTTSWLADAVTTATPLGEGFTTTLTKPELYKALFFGNVAGSVGETSALLILIGGAILLAFGIIKWHIPVFYIATVFVMSLIMGQDPIFHILAGGLMLGAFFMATDYVTSPLTTTGRIIFAVGAGVLVMLIRRFGNMPEGVNYSILLMNAFTPLIDRYTRPRPYGFVKAKRGA